MPFAMACVLAVASPAAAMGLVVAQDLSPQAFGRAFGEVRTAEGKPWSGAKVTLLGLPVPDNPFVGEAHRVTVDTDDGGRFRAQVRSGLVHTVWAEGRPEKGRVRATGAAEMVVVQQPVVLTELPRPVPLPAVRFEGLEEWLRFAPLEFAMIDKTGNQRLVQLAVDDRGRARMPLLLGDLVEFRVVGKGSLGRRLLFRIEVPRHEVHRARPPEGEEEPLFVLRAPAVADARFKVVGHATGKPVADATIYQSSQLGHAWPVARTGADGSVEAPVHRDGFFFARAAGLATGYFPPSEVRGNAMECSARAGISIRGRVSLVPGRPLAAATLWLLTSASHQAASGPRQVSWLPEVLRADRDGCFEIDGVSPTEPPELRLVLTDAQIAQLPEEWHGIHPVVPLDITHQIEEGRPIDVALHDLCPVALRCQNPDRTPASLAQVRVLGAGPCSTFYPRLSWRTDGQGVCRLLLPANRKVGLAVRGRNGFLLSGLETRRLADDLLPAGITVTIPSTPVVSGRVLDPAGAPVPNAPVLMDVNLRRPFRVEVPEQTFPAKGNAARLVSFEGFDHSVLYTLATYWTSNGGEDGCFRFPVPGLAHECLLSVHYRVRPGYGSARLMVDEEAVEAQETLPGVEILLRSLR